MYSVNSVLESLHPSANRYINHLFTALSLHGKTKASSSSLNTYIVHAGTNFLKVVNEESTQLSFPFTWQLPRAKVKMKYE